jgi:hypothetical protein
MRRRLSIFAPGLVLLAGVLLLSRRSDAKPEYTRKERKECEYCHVTNGNHLGLTDAGRYYKDNLFSLKGWVDKSADKKPSPDRSSNNPASKPGPIRTPARRRAPTIEPGHLPE